MTRPIWTNAAGARHTVRAGDGRLYTSAQATIWRWREAYQNDFAALMDWCVAESFSDADHNPVAAIGEDRSKNVIERPGRAGEPVVLDAAASTDPDGGALTCRWFHYAEAEGYEVRKRLALRGKTAPRVTVALEEAGPGVRIHIILELRDDGDPPLFAYRRVILVVE